MAEIATQNQADALDIVQDTMIKLVDKYSDKPSAQWKPLFYRILQNTITDYFRIRTIQRNLFFWKTTHQDDESDDYNITQATDHITPEREVSGERNIMQILATLKKLPRRQQQCFMLRSWEDLSVNETATIMGCSEGSVKTHYSRAREALKNALNEALFEE